MAKNLKGGYKIVSLNGLDLVGESLAIAGLYDKLAKSYDKPILVTGIVIDGEKKKNAFVQVEVLDDGIKINDLYGYDLLVEEDGDITVSANPQELPNTADASAGQVLKLDAQKKPVWGDEAEELPSTASASQGNALLLDAEKKPVWGAIASGTKLYKHKLNINGTVLMTLYGNFNTEINTPVLLFNNYDKFISHNSISTVSGASTTVTINDIVYAGTMFLAQAVLEDTSVSVTATQITSVSDTVTEL